MSKHTPGPWKAGRHPHNIVGIVNGEEEIVAQIGDMPCIGGHDDLAAQRGSDMERANAGLITAAPELLEALMAYDKAFGNRGPYQNTDPDHLALIARTRAAIAKATGEPA